MGPALLRQIAGRTGAARSICLLGACTSLRAVWLGPDVTAAGVLADVLAVARSVSAG